MPSTVSSPVVLQAQADDPLRYTFVEMLFALAISQVAVHTADLASASSPLRDMLPSFSHLVLSLAVISASWVGWRQSQSPGMKLQIQSIFSRRFLSLMLDVLLVIFYFALVRSVEIQQKDGSAILATSSASPEAMWLVAVFAAYVIWDLLADVFSPDCLTASGVWARVMQGARVAAGSVAASGLCTFLAYRVYEISESRSENLEVVLLDASLLALVLLFRVLKVFELPLARLLHVDGCRAFQVQRYIVKHPRSLAGVLLVLHLALTWSAANAETLHGWFARLPWRI